MANKNIVTFRLTKGRSPVSFSIPTKTMMLEKKNESGLKTLKRVHYIKGVDSIWVEDYKGDQKPNPIVFEDGILEVEAHNRPLLELLKKHKWYNKEYEVIDEDLQAIKELEQFELEEAALSRINISGEDELMANALILIGEHAISMSEAKVKLELKRKAKATPQALIDEMNSSDYKVKYVGALGIQKGVLKIDPSRTQVQWADGKTIITVPVGQSPIKKLSDFLSENTEASQITLQEIGIQNTRMYNKKKEADLSAAVNEVIASKDVTLSDEEKHQNDLEEARQMYKELNNGKEVPNVKKNDLDWIMSKLD
ncbi:hypothetical protein Phi46:3_gp100 [Cellulophaga phage phi46:3]|uniref:Uncharacterized protein n=1 Tax=Cellulophaga phage phi46:3 TaxID=1327985 RepID=R9ZZT2_9CAUD|nr:hypothetical protein Phi46:3_gp100 [Cellulophaga phage phi46:3]AGO48844.1 hypothetical protein Phi46:3_gp100 [Cellulophaga phage phi46:3]